MAGQFCENCGAPIVPGNRFCLQCGAPVDGGQAAQERTAQSGSIICTSCGAANPMGTMFCLSCGMPIDDEAYDIYARPTEANAVYNEPSFYNDSYSTPQPTDAWQHTPQTSYPTDLNPPKKPSILPYVLTGLAVALVVAGGGIFLMRDRIFTDNTEKTEEVVEDEKAKEDTKDEETTDDEQAQREAEEQAQREAEEQAQREAEEQAQREAEEQAQREAEEQARREAEAAAAAQADQTFHDTLVTYYSKLPSYDSRIKDVATTWNYDHFSGRDYKSQTAYGLESEIYADYLTLSSLTVPSGSAWASQHNLLVQTYDAAYGRIHTMCESWRVNMQYSDPENHTSEINYPITSQNDANGINYDKKRYDSLYPQINL